MLRTHEANGRAKASGSSLMLLARICAGYPVHAEVHASVECKVMVPMLFLLETHSHTHAHGYPHAHARVHCVSASIRTPPPPLPLHAHPRTLLKGVNLRERVFAHRRLVVIAAASSPVWLALHNHQLGVAASV